MKPMSLLPLSILLVTSGCPFGPVDGPPPPDDCSSPSALDGVDVIEVGALQEGEFVPWQDGEVVELTYGSQGGAMLGVALTLRGDELPGCIPHSLQLAFANGAFLASSEYPVRTYPAGEGARSTATIWLVVEGGYPQQGDQLALTLQAGGFEIQRSLLLEAPRPESIVLGEQETPLAGEVFWLQIVFDRWIYSDMTVTIESSDPAVLRPATPTIVLSPDDSTDAIWTSLEAVAPGGPVTISVTANGRTIETELTVQ